MKIIGKSIYAGIVVGPAYVLRPYEPVIHEEVISPEKTDQAICCYRDGHARANQELSDLHGGLNDERGEILSSHIEILNDPCMEKEILAAVRDKQFSAEWAVFSVYQKYIQLMESLDNPLLQGRATDLEDVLHRLLRCMEGLPASTNDWSGPPAVLIAEELHPSDAAQLHPDHTLAIVTQTGGETSHAAIIARSFGIPSVAGVPDITNLICSGDTVIVDAVNGVVIASPTEDEIRQYELESQRFRENQSITRTYLEKPAVTQDGAEVEVYLNLSSETAEKLASLDGIAGVGLLRTEFLYMDRSTLPSEQEQYEFYSHLLSLFAPRPVVLRTLDIGGDKPAECLNLPDEKNPFLGHRALRLCFSRPELLLTQFRAALRASVHGNLRIMLPMVGGLEDIRRAKDLFFQARDELSAQKIPVADSIQLGVMLEIPSAALMADRIAQEVDFASIGTNDLCQYLLAVDRTNAAVESYYQRFHPAVLRMLRYCAEEFHRAGKPLSVCGEMAGDVRSARLLLGFGIRKLSMGAAMVAGIKRMVTQTTLTELKNIADQALAMDTDREIEEFLNNIIQ